MPLSIQVSSNLNEWLSIATGDQPILPPACELADEFVIDQKRQGLKGRCRVQRHYPRTVLLCDSHNAVALSIRCVDEPIESVYRPVCRGWRIVVESHIQEELQRRVPYDSANRRSHFAVDDGPAVVIVRPMSPFIILTFQGKRLLPDILQVPASAATWSQFCLWRRRSLCVLCNVLGEAEADGLIGFVAASHLL